MAVRLFNLRDVPEDEAEGIRVLLSEHEISFYETHAGGWGIGTAAIWLHDEAELERASSLLNEFQELRSAEMRAEYDRLKKEGLHDTFFDKFRQHPLLVVVFVLLSLFILYATLSPFLNFGK